MDKSKLVEAKYKDYNFILKVVMNICLASAYSGYCLAYFNTINFDDTVRIFQIEADRALMQGTLSFCVSLGAAFGGYTAKFLIENNSRRACFIKLAAVSIIVTLLLQTKLIFIVFICRTIQGITVGMNTVLRATYIKQFVPLEIAAKFGVINQVFYSLGLIFAFAFTYLISFFLKAESYWRIVYFMPILIMGLQIYNLIYCFPYETPKYLLENNRKEEAIQLISLIYKTQYVEQRTAELQKLLHIIRELPEHQQELKQIGHVTSQNQTAQKELTSNKIAIQTAYHLATLQQVSGIQVIILYVGEIMLSINPNLQKIVPLILQVEGFFASLFTMKLLDSYGRKQLIQGGLLVMATTLFMVAFSFFVESQYKESSFFWNMMIIIALFIGRGIFSLTIGPVIWLYLPEIVQPRITGMATMLNWITAAFVSFIYPIVVQAAGTPSLIFFIFGLILIAGYILNNRWMVQTKGKAEWQVRQEYDEKLKAAQ